RRQWINDSDECKVQSDEFNSALITLHSALPLLAFRELDALARALLPVLLALLDARVACDEARLLQGWAQFGVNFHAHASDAMAHRAGLPGGAAARNVDEDVELRRRLG